MGWVIAAVAPSGWLAIELDTVEYSRVAMSGRHNAKQPRNIIS